MKSTATGSLQLSMEGIFTYLRPAQQLATTSCLLVDAANAKGPATATVNVGSDSQ